MEEHTLNNIYELLDAVAQSLKEITDRSAGRSVGGWKIGSIGWKIGSIGWKVGSIGWKVGSIGWKQTRRSF